MEHAEHDTRERAGNLVGTSAAMRRLADFIAHVARADSTVLVRGESGVGKELVAREVHRQSRRAHQPLVVVDCATLHDNLLQSELFGHERGAYTGAVSAKRGLFEVADRGTILLDEIAELTPALQVKLLRVLETGTFRRLGGTVDVHVDVRVIAATNRQLETMLERGEFREDLFYRLNVFPLDVPPLRERPEDIPELVRHFVSRDTVQDRGGPVHVNDEVLELLLRHTWPGNVRELQHVIERALVLCDGTDIEPRHLPAAVQVAGAGGTVQRSARTLSLEEIERQHIRRVLDSCGGHRERAAHVLRISERTLYRRLREGLDGPAARPESLPESESALAGASH
ncbi:MAG TPA: sigma 54-interacting transcriptional regulator [Candidatus Eisenbacteria bacterium]|nr:sigma 54-interacting transcriptional regulator [Candidatus Eisenbacteria bacterium]